MREKIKLVFCFFLGTFFIAFQAAGIREIMAAENGDVVIPALFITFLSLWTAAGYKLLKKQLPPTPAVLSLPIAALAGILLAAPPAIAPLQGIAAIIFRCAAMTLPFGLTAGAVIPLLFEQEKPLARFYFGLGGLAGGMVFSFCFAGNEFFSIFRIIGICALPLILAHLVSYASENKGFYYFTVFIMLLFLSLLMLPGLLASPQTLSRIETREGLYLIKPAKDGSLIIFRNGKELWRADVDSRKNAGGALLASLQPDRNGLTVLVIASPFSRIPTILARLQHISRLETILPAQGLSVRHSCTTIPSVHENYADFFNRTSERYDLVLITDRSIPPGNEAKIINAAASRLTKNGVIAVDRTRTTADIIAGKFSRHAVLPGNLIVGGGKEISGNFDILSDRFDRLAGGHAGGLPPGILPVLVSPQNVPPPNDLSAAAGDDMGIRLKQATALLLVIWLLSRFLMTRKSNRSLAFGAIENGFYAGGILVLSFFSAGASIDFSVYRDSGFILGTFYFFLTYGSTISARAGFSKLTLWISCLLPLLFLVIPEKIQYFWPLMTVLIIAGLSSGLSGQLLRRKLTVKPASWLVAWTWGGALAGGLATIVFNAQADIMLCVAIFILARLPVTANLFLSKNP